jgi:hypothetical protein
MNILVPHDYCRNRLRVEAQLIAGCGAKCYCHKARRKVVTYLEVRARLSANLRLIDYVTARIGCEY